MLNYKFVSINAESNLNDERIPKQVEKEMGSKNKNFSILQPLMKNYHVLRHPAIQKEVEERAAADNLECAVDHVLTAGFRTRDLAAEGCTTLGCAAMGKELLSFL